MLKLAVSADGKAGLAGRKPVGITGEAARARVHQMRAESDAILVGIGTVMSDDPQLTCRLPGMVERSPVRVVLDARLRMPLATAWSPPRARRRPGFSRQSASPIAEDVLRAKGVEVFRVEGKDGRLDLRGAEGARRARHHATDGRGRADRRGVFRQGRSGRRGGAVSLAEAIGATASMRWRACR